MGGDSGVEFQITNDVLNLEGKGPSMNVESE